MQAAAAGAIPKRRRWLAPIAPARGERRGLPASWPALVAYCLLSFLFFGAPLAGHPGRSYVGVGADPEIFIWSFGWWPHALLHLQNPFISHAIWAPEGFNLAWATSAPGLALAFGPLTLLAGPVVAYNAAAVLMPAFAAWTAFLLCRYLTAALWPSLAGGYLFGFSSYMLGQEEGHLHMTSAFLVPLVALAILRYLDGRQRARGLAVTLGVILALQLSFSTEVFFSLALAIAAALAIGWCVAPARRARLRSVVPPLAFGYLAAAALMSPLLLYALTAFRSESVNPPGRYVVDLLNLVVPSGVTLLSTQATTRLAAHFPGNSSEQDAYLGAPALVIVAWFCLRRRGTAAGRFLVVSLLVTLVAALGTALHVAGHRVAPAPWALLAGLPLFNNVITARFSLYLALGVAVIVALWAASDDFPRLLRAVLTALAVLVMVPQLQFGLWKETPVVPSFFTADRHRHCLPAGANVLIVVPQSDSGNALLWQALAGFRFNMAGGDISPEVPDSFMRFAAVRALRLGLAPPRGAADVLAFARAKQASAILVEQRYAYYYRWLLGGLGHAERAGGMLVYAIGPGAGAIRGCLGARTELEPK